MASTDATPLPLKNTALRVTFPILDNTGALVTGAAGLDSEVSKDAGTFADCTNEATEIATSSGIYYLDLTSTEMNADTVAIVVKSSTSDSRPTILVVYPQSAGKVKVDVQTVATQTASAAGAVTFPGTIASTTNITAGTITTVTNLTNAPTSGDFTATMKTSIGTAVAASAVASVTGNVGGNVVGSVGSISGVSFPTNFGTLAISSPDGFVSVDPTDIPTSNDVADAVLKRDWTLVTGEADYSLLNAARFLRNKWAVVGTTLTVNKEDGTTPAWTGTVTVTPGAEPITGNTP